MESNLSRTVVWIDDGKNIFWGCSRNLPSLCSCERIELRNLVNVIRAASRSLRVSFSFLGPAGRVLEVDMDLFKDGKSGVEAGAENSKVRCERDRQREQGKARSAAKQSNVDVSRGGF